jgi:biuret amidohydrolase
MSSFDPARTAIVAVHFQNDIVGPDGAFSGFFRAEVERTGVVTTAQGDTVVTHQRVGGFQDSELDAILRGAGIDTVVFTGVATNFSVEGTARVASDLGYRTVVVSDACSAASDAVHTASLESLGLLAEITTVDEVLVGLKS